MSDGSARLAPVPLRLALGSILCFHGYKILYGGGLTAFMQTCKSLDLPYQDILAQVAAWGQLAGGAMILIGLLTRLAALVNCGTFFVAVWKVHLGKDIVAGLKDLPNYEFALLILGACWCLVLMGGGALSVDGMFRRSSPAPSKA